MIVSVRFMKRLFIIALVLVFWATITEDASGDCNENEAQRTSNAL